MKAAVLRGKAKGPILVQLREGMALEILNSSTPWPMAKLPRTTVHDRRAKDNRQTEDNPLVIRKCSFSLLGESDGRTGCPEKAVQSPALGTFSIQPDQALRSFCFAQHVGLETS